MLSLSKHGSRLWAAFDRLRLSGSHRIGEPSRRPRGFILIETMVALLVLALVLGSVLATIAASARRQQAALQTRRALMVARSELAAVGSSIPAAPGTLTGISDDIGWRVTIDPAGSAGRFGPIARITVAAGPLAAPPRVTLTELRLIQPTAVRP